MWVVIIRGPALSLRFPSPGDAPALFALARDPEVTRFFSWSYAEERDAAGWISGRSAAREAGEWLGWGGGHRDHGPGRGHGPPRGNPRGPPAGAGPRGGGGVWGPGG